MPITSSSKLEFKTKIFNLVFYITSVAFKKKAIQSTKNKVSNVSNILKLNLFIAIKSTTFFKKNRFIDKLNIYEIK